MKNALFVLCLVPFLAMPAFAGSSNAGAKPMVVAEGVEVGVGGVGVDVGDQHRHRHHGAPSVVLDREHHHHHSDRDSDHRCGHDEPGGGVLKSLGGERAFLERQAEPLPDVDQRFGQRVDQPVVVKRARRDAQPLGAFGHGRIVDRLDVDAVIGEQ